MEFNKEKEVKNLFFEIFKANGDREVAAILEKLKSSVLGPHASWGPFGDKINNFSIISNQQRDSVGPLGELVVNSVDGCNMKECKKRGIDPRDEKKAPRSPEEAVDSFFDLKRRGLSPNALPSKISIIASGRGNKAPDLIVVDEGEGQRPEDFKKTLTSINEGKGNKDGIPFLHGVFNQGSTGSFRCAKYQLIVSKRDPELFKKEYGEGAINRFGFTIVRKHKLTPQEKGCSWYEDLRIDGKTPSFNLCESESITLPNQEVFKSGCLKKMFSYNLPRDAKGGIAHSLFFPLNRLLYKSSLPFTLYECRDSYAYLKDSPTGVYFRKTCGNFYTLRSKVAINNFKHIFITQEDKKMGRLKITASVYDSPNVINIHTRQNHRRRYIGRNKPINFTIKGQVHHSLGNDKVLDWGFSLLVKDLQIHIDCDSLESNFLSELIMSGRQGFFQSPEYEYLVDKVKKALQGSDLSVLNKERKEKLLSADCKDLNKHIEAIFRIKKSQGFLKKIEGSLKKEEDIFDLKEKGTFEKLKRPSIIKSLIDPLIPIKTGFLPLGGKVFKFKIDPKYNFLLNESRGDIKIKILNYEPKSEASFEDSKPSSTAPESFKPSIINSENYLNVSYSSTQDSEIDISLEPKEKIKVGDRMKLRLDLITPKGNLEAVFNVSIIKPKEKKGLKKKEVKSTSPPVIEVIKNEEGQYVDRTGGVVDGDWDDCALKVIADKNKKIEAILINTSCPAFKAHLSLQKDEKKISNARIGGLVKLYFNGIASFSAHERINEKRKEREQDTIDSCQHVADIFDNQYVRDMLSTDKGFSEYIETL